LIRTFLSALVAAALFLALSSNAPAVKKLSVEQTIWDFESLDEGVIAPHTFKLVNKGTEPLNIDHNIIVDRPANITATLDKYELGVDEGANLTVSLDTTGLGNRRIVSFIYLKYDDKTVALTIRGRINAAPVPLIQVSPMSHDFGTIEQGEARKATFTYANVGQGILEVKKILFITKDQGFIVTRDIEKTELEANDEADFDVTFRGWQTGTVEGFLLLESSSGGGPGTITKIDLSATVIPKIRGLVLEPPRPVRVEDAEPGATPGAFTLDLKNNYPFDLIVSYNDGKDTAAIERFKTSQLQLGLNETETDERLKLGLEIILRKKQPPKRPELEPPPVIEPQAPEPAEAADTGSAPAGTADTAETE